MNNKESLSILLKNLKQIQGIRNNTYKKFEYIYKGVISKFFRSSSVSVTFRISIPGFKNLSKEKKENIKISLEKNILLKNKKGVFVGDLENFVNSVYEIGGEVNSDIIFMKRTSNEKDRYAGNISFPGGKYEKEDKNLLVTAVRETREEIGISLLDDKSPFPSRVICQNCSLHTPLGFKFLVSSYIFVLFDLEDEIHSNLNLSTNEVSDVIFTPVSYLYSIKDKESNKIKKVSINSGFMGTLNVEKVVLNDNPDFLLYGMTLRLIAKVLNYSKVVMYPADDFECKNMKQRLGVLVLKIYELVSVPYNAYLACKILLFLIIGFIALRFSNLVPKF
jgi:8-oxo-dGTP pyrophosphatase MutT (NUDIX family)